MSTPRRRRDDAAGAPRHRWLLDWRWQVAVVAALLTVAGIANVRLHADGDHGVLRSGEAAMLRGLLHEEANLRWRVLAREGPPLETARRIGEVRRSEREHLDRLVQLGSPGAAEIGEAMGALHEAIDYELGQLAVGRVGEALAAEQEGTLPLFERVDGLLVEEAAAGTAAARAAHARAHAVLGLTFLLVCVVLGVLLRAVARTHLRSAAAISGALDQERRAKESLESAQAMVRHQATHDPLTGIANRLALRERLEGLRATAGTLCVLYIDLDGFKPINDCFGHQRGDEVLCAVAAALRDNLRAGELPARIGGDEFAVVAEVADAAAGHGLAQRLRGVIDGVCAAQQVGVPVSASIGVAVGPAAEADRLVRDADRAMYEEKHRRPRLVPGQR